MSMTWVQSRKGWMKKYRDRMFSVSCRQLGCEPTKEASWRAAREWWNKKQVEIDAEPTADDDHRRMEAYARMAEIADQCMNGTLPDEVSEAILGKARLEELRRKTLALFERADPVRTIGLR
jgi:hypothetical protein